MLLLTSLLSASFLSTLCAEEFTAFEFSRLINTCDSDGDVEIGPAGTSRVVWSYNDHDPSSEDHILPHENRGSKSVNLLGHVSEDVPLELDIRNIDLLVKDVKVESSLAPGEPVDTLYYCKVFELPRDKKRHIVRVEPIVEPAENMGHVHHIVIYNCPDLTSDLFTYENDCYLDDNPDLINQCLSGQYLAAWAVGGGIWNTPANAGYPMGEGYAGFVLMQVHYDNPFRHIIVDSSGMRLWHTETLREFDAGILLIGRSIDTIFVPPLEEAYEVTGYCRKDCTEQIFPDGAHAFGVFLHAHLLGREINLQHVRDGVELPTVENNENYDFNFQETVAIDPELELKPGDEFILTCTYNSMDKDEPTTGGESTREEMCYAFLSYYPLVPDAPATCQSGVYGEPYFNVSTYLDICDYNFTAVGDVSDPVPFEPLPVVDPCKGFERGDYDVIPHASDSLDPSEYDNSLVMDEDGKYTMFWSFDRDASAINVAVRVQTSGWVGFGISPNGGMIGSDVYIGWFDDKDGHVYFRDRYATAMALPGIDKSQDAYDIRVSQFVADTNTGGDGGDGSKDTSGTPKDHTVLYVVVPLLLVCVIAAVAYVLYRRKKINVDDSNLIGMEDKSSYEAMRD